MKTFKILLGAAMTIGLCAPAVADVTGEVDVTGKVTGACSVVNGESNGNTFTGAIDLGELAGANGKLIQKSGSMLPVTVICNSGAPHISMTATSLVGTLAPADATYTNVVGYTAHLGLGETSGTETFTAVSANSVSPPATNATLAHPLSGNSGNVTVLVDTLTSTNAILTAGTYGTPGGGGGIIAITISPS